MKDPKDPKDLWETGLISQSIKYFGSDSSLATVEKLMARLQAELDELHKDAEELANEHWAKIRAINDTKKTSEKTKLGLRTRKKTKVITLDWYYNRYFFNSKAKNPWSSHIRKGTGTGYRLESILKHAQDWEREIVTETETKAAALRELAVARVKLMDALVKFIDTQT